jgi:hypothetical protein
MTPTQRSNLHRAGLALVALLLWLGAAARGDSLTAAQRELREREIANKSEAERARLQRNFKTFRELPADEQKKLRRLDLELKEDARNLGSLRVVMNEYYDWLLTLTPGQAQELRDERDPNRREMLVRELLKQQQDQALASGSARAGKLFPGLTAGDLAAALGVIEKVMKDKQILSAEELQQLQSKKGVARHAYVLELAFRRGPGGAPGPFPWNSPQVFDAIVESISGERQRDHIREPHQNPQERQRRLNWALMGGFGAEYEKMKPTRGELEKFFVQLKSHEQDEIMRLPYDQQQQQLTRMYMTKMSIEDPDNYPRPPQAPFWMRGPRGGGFRAQGQPRPGDEQRAADRGAARKSDGAAKKAQRDKKTQTSKDEPE